MFLEFVEFLRELVLASYDDVLIFLQTGTGRNQVTADDILLEAFEVVDAAADGGFAEHLGGLLEGCCRDEAVGLERRPRDALKHETCRGRTGLASCHHLKSLTLKRRVLAAQVAGGDNLSDFVAL